MIIQNRKRFHRVSFDQNQVIKTADQKRRKTQLTAHLASVKNVTDHVAIQGLVSRLLGW